MTRLNKDIRLAIIDNAVKMAGIGKLDNDIKLRRAKLANDARIEALGGEEILAEIESGIKKINKIASQERMKAVSGMGSLCNIGAHYIYVNMGGMSSSINYSGDTRHYSESAIHKYPVPVGRQTFTADNPLSVEFMEIEKAQKDLKDRETGIRLQVRSSINEFTTVEKLLKAWPEAKDLLPPDVGKKTTKLPAVRVKDLNELLGLPKESEE